MAAAYLQRMGERIRERREELGLSRPDVARAMPGKTNENAIYRWEKGLHRPNDDALEALAAVLKVDPTFFLTDQAQDGTGDLMGALRDGDESQLDRIEAKLDALAGALVDGATQPDALTRLQAAFEGLRATPEAEPRPARRTARRAQR